MSGPATSYRDALRDSAESIPIDLEARLAVLFARGVAAHPGMRLDAQAFARHLALCGTDVGAKDLETVHAEDLYLVGAALGREASAIAALRQAHDGVIRGYLRRVEATTQQREEIQRSIWDLLLLGAAVAGPKLASYSGRGQLAGFIGISAQRIAVTTIRRSAAQKRALAQARDVAIVTCGDPEISMIKERYRGQFEESVRDAVGVLDDRERMIMRMLVVDGHTLDRIAEVYGVNQSSVSRWLAKARLKVLAEARRLLRERLNVAESEFESLLQLVLSQVDLSVSQVLSGVPQVALRARP
jgi:RNA polymerase sigma-70 factor (ECF subfamily)